MLLDEGRRYEALIFLTGAVVLSLEVLSSRMMTPYFGVSLYIWTGILSITLTFLAIGYHLGGRVSHRYKTGVLELLFLAAPIASAASIALACALYPALFPELADIDLVFGSFVGAILLLALPLVGLSAMNPVLIALVRSAQVRGDAGAGRIFFVSTLGSVAGVLLTAFVFIPNITNYRASLLLSLTLCATVAVFAFQSVTLSRSNKLRLYAGCIAVALLSALLMLGQMRYLNVISSDPNRLYEFDVRAEYTSIFGNVKVVEIRPRIGTDISILAYIQDGLIQNRTTLDGVSVSMYTHVLQALAHAFAPDAKKAVVLGLGAGIVPRHFKHDGLAVSVVEINADALKAATQFFRFDPNGIALHWEDARTFVRRCRNTHDIAVVDLFHGDNTPDYLMTVEFFRDLNVCLRTGGVVIMNTLLDRRNEQPMRHLLATVASAFDRVFEFRSPGGNAFIVATNGNSPEKIALDSADVPASLLAAIEQTLLSGRSVRQQDLIGYQAITDDHNVFSVLYADTEIALRRSLARFLPPHILIN